MPDVPFDDFLLEVEGAAPKRGKLLPVLGEIGDKCHQNRGIAGNGNNDRARVVYGDQQTLEELRPRVAFDLEEELPMLRFAAHALDVVRPLERDRLVLGGPDRDATYRGVANH